MISIVLADDHSLVRECIASLLNAEPDLKVVSQCSNGRQLVKQVKRLCPNVAIVDITMPELNGMDAVKQIRKTNPATRVIALSAHTEQAYIRNMLKAGVSGYVIKSSAYEDLIKAIRNGSRGRVYFSEEIAEVVETIRCYSVRHRQNTDFEKDLLTPREREVLQLIAESFTSKEIAAKLHISETTVKTHRNHLMDKLKTRDVAGLTRSAIRLKLIEAE